jgi:hypothetical protein
MQCTAGTTTFHFSAAAGNNSSYCLGANCSIEWMTIRSAAGQSIALSGGCTTTCEVCQPVACTNICIAPQRMKPQGENTTWDGSYFLMEKCGAGVTCRETACAPPGKYIATMCATLDGSDGGMGAFCSITQQGAAPQRVCVDVPFDYPSATVVEGVIPTK